MSESMKGISSMATRQMLQALLRPWHEQGGKPTSIESVGGVEAVKRIEAGGACLDLAFLDSDALARLAALGHLIPSSVRALATSQVAVAVRAGAVQPPIASAADVRAAVLAAPSIGCSTGPSGVGLMRMFETWGIAEQIRTRMVQARPGVPVGALVAEGAVSLGFQQLSELIHVKGIDVVGLLPDDMAITTVFSGAVVTGARYPTQAAALLDFMASEDRAALKRAEGLGSP